VVNQWDLDIRRGSYIVSKGRTNDNKLSLVKSILLRLFAEGEPLFSGEVWKNA